MIITMQEKNCGLKQPVFLCICKSADSGRQIQEKMHDDIRKLHEKVTFQMNDTHPTVAVAELMRILLDDEGLNWEEAWDVTTKDLCIHQPYHHGRSTGEMADRPVLPTASANLSDRAGDRPPVRACRYAEMYPGNQDKIEKMAILYDGQVRMANLAIVAGYSVNGVARLHTEILKTSGAERFL